MSDLNNIPESILSSNNFSLSLSGCYSGTHVYDLSTARCYFDSDKFDDTTRSNLRSLYDYFTKVKSPDTIVQPTGIMPPGVIHIDDSLIIFERPPSYQNIQLIPHLLENINYDKSDTIIYRLPIPWTIYFVTYSVYSGVHYPNSIAMYFSHNSLQSSDFSSTQLYLPPLCNFYTNGELCNPLFDSMDELNRYSNDIAGVINASYNWIWDTGTNVDLTMNIAEFIYQSRHNTDLRDNNPLSKVITSNLYPTTYYVDTSILNSFFLSWEKLSLQDVSSYSWPNPSAYKKNMQRIGQLGESLLHSYFDYHGIDADECREYNEEEDDFYYSYDELRYHEYVHNTLITPANFYDVYDRIVASSLADTPAFSKPSISNVVNNYFSSISAQSS